MKSGAFEITCSNVLGFLKISKTCIGIYSYAYLMKSGAFEITCSNSAKDRESSSSRSASSKIWWRQRITQNVIDPGIILTMILV